MTEQNKIDLVLNDAAENWHDFSGGVVTTKDYQYLSVRCDTTDSCDYINGCLYCLANGNGNCLICKAGYAPDQINFKCALISSMEVDESEKALVPNCKLYDIRRYLFDEQTESHCFECETGYSVINTKAWTENSLVPYTKEDICKSALNLANCREFEDHLRTKCADCHRGYFYDKNSNPPKCTPGSDDPNYPSTIPFECNPKYIQCFTSEHEEQGRCGFLNNKNYFCAQDILPYCSIKNNRCQDASFARNNADVTWDYSSFNKICKDEKAQYRPKYIKSYFDESAWQLNYEVHKKGKDFEWIADEPIAEFVGVKAYGPDLIDPNVLVEICYDWRLYDTSTTLCTKYPDSLGLKYCLERNDDILCELCLPNIMLSEENKICQKDKKCPEGCLMCDNYNCMVCDEGYFQQSFELKNQCYKPTLDHKHPKRFDNDIRTKIFNCKYLDLRDNLITLNCNNCAKCYLCDFGYIMKAQEDGTGKKVCLKVNDPENLGCKYLALADAEGLQKVCLECRPGWTQSQRDNKLCIPVVRRTITNFFPWEFDGNTSGYGWDKVHWSYEI